MWSFPTSGASVGMDAGVAGRMLWMVVAVAVWRGCGGEVVGGEEVFDSAVQAVVGSCRRLYTPNCMQLEFLTQLEGVLTSNEYELLPGVFLSRGNVTSPALPPGLDPRAAPDPDAAARAAAPVVAERLFRQLATWTLSVPVFGNNTLQQLRGMMKLYLSEEQDVQEGRKTKFWKYMGPALLTIGFSLLSALISKSLTMSIIALVLTLVGGGGANFGFRSPPAASPPVAYRSPPPLRSHVTSELQYVDELPDEGAQPYVYVNRKAWKSRSIDEYAPLYQ